MNFALKDQACALQQARERRDARQAHFTIVSCKTIFIGVRRKAFKNYVITFFEFWTPLPCIRSGNPPFRTSDYVIARFTLWSKISPCNPYIHRSMPAPADCNWGLYSQYAAFPIWKPILQCNFQILTCELQSQIQALERALK